MASALNSYGMTADEQRLYLDEQRQNGFLDLPQDKRAFALEFIQSGSYVEASNAIGIQTATGRRWLRDPLISAFIQYLNQQKEHYSLIDAGFIETQYLILLSKLLGEEAVPMVDKDGTAFLAKKFHSSEAVGCLRDLAKVSGNYKEEGATINVQVTSLTDEQRQILNAKLDETY